MHEGLDEAAADHDAFAAIALGVKVDGVGVAHEGGELQVFGPSDGADGRVEDDLAGVPRGGRREEGAIVYRSPCQIRPAGEGRHRRRRGRRQSGLVGAAFQAGDGGVVAVFGEGKDHFAVLVLAECGS